MKLKRKMVDIKKVWKKDKNLVGMYRHYSGRKLFNFVRMKINNKRGVAKIGSYPYTLTIEPTNVCNLRCPFCPTGKGEFGRPKGMMTFENYKRIIDEIGDYLVMAYLFLWGEPLLNKDIYRMITYTQEKNIGTCIHTNLTIFNEEDARRMVDSGLEYLTISLDGASQSAYVKYRRGGDFNKVIANLRLLVKTREKLRSSNPCIEWKFLVFRHNQHEIEEARKLAGKLGVDAFIVEPGMVEDESWRPTIEGYCSEDENPKANKCNWLWTHTVINWDGGVVPCCWIYHQTEDFGNIYKENFKNIWNNPKYQASRKLFSKKIQYSDYASGITTPCAGCVRFKNWLSAINLRGKK